MQGEKQINYVFELSSKDVNGLLSEFAEILSVIPSLKTSAPNTAEFVNMLNKLLSRHDFNPEYIATLRKEMKDRGFKVNLVADLAVSNTPKAVETTPQSHPMDTENNVSPIKQARKAKPKAENA